MNRLNEARGLVARHDTGGARLVVRGRYWPGVGWVYFAVQRGSAAERALLNAREAYLRKRAGL